MSLESENKQFNALHLKYEVRALRLLLKEFKYLFGKIPFNNLSLDMKISEAIITLNFDDEALKKILFKIHYTIGLEYGRLMSRQFRKENPIQLKAFRPIASFEKEFKENILEYFRIYGGRQIKTLKKTAIKSVMIELRKGTKLGETEEQLRDRIMKRVNQKDFYLWQAQRIARTETTTAMNDAQDIAMISSGAEMDKIWITRRDGRERESHHVANNQKVGQKELFLVGGYRMKYPGDRTNGAPAKEIVNCRCKISYVAKRSRSGRLNFNDEEAIQEALRERLRNKK